MSNKAATKKAATKKALSNRHYIESMGNKCPFCMSKILEGFEFESDCDYACRGVKCHNCGETWTENFKMVGYEK